MKPYYQDDSVVIYHGDCREILPTLEEVDLVLTDPPYGLDGHAHRGHVSWTNHAKGNDYGEITWDKEPASKEHIDLILQASKKCIIWGGNFFELPQSRAWLVWDKMNSGDFGDCELAWTNLDQPIRVFHHRWNGMIRDSEKDVKRVHPTQKPIRLKSWCIGFVLSDIRKPKILDPFMGSGSTLRAAKDLELQAIGIDIEESYCEAAAHRMEQEVLTLTDISIPQDYASLTAELFTKNE